MLHGRLRVLVFGAHTPPAAPCARSASVFSARFRRVQVYYFFVKTKMSGFFQTVFYFGYSAPPPCVSTRCSARPALPLCHSRACRGDDSDDFLRGPRRAVRHLGLLRLLRLRAPHLCEYQVGLTFDRQASSSFGLRSARGVRGGQGVRRAAVRPCVTTNVPAPRHIIARFNRSVLLKGKCTHMGSGGRLSQYPQHGAPKGLHHIVRAQGGLRSIHV